jgi:hypothetical protein
MRKTLAWIALLVLIAACQVQEIEIPVEEGADQETIDDLNARKKQPEGDNGPITLPNGIEPCGDPAVYDLFAGQHHDVGSITISNDFENLYVTYFTTESFQKLHLWIGNDFREMPTNNGGNPVIGHFFYRANANNADTYTFKIPLTELAKRNIVCDKSILVVAHAEVNGETAFGGNFQIPCSKRWAFFMEYTIVCCEDEPGGNSETAFAKGNWVFVNGGCNDFNPECLPGLGISSTRWGWAYNLTGLTAESYNLYASAAKNDVNKGKIVGRVEIEYTTWIIEGVPTAVGSIIYFVEDDWVLEEVHVYAGDNRPTSAAPGQYGHSAEFPTGASVYVYNINFPNPDVQNDGVWFIAHAVVKPYALP